MLVWILLTTPSSNSATFAHYWTEFRLYDLVENCFGGSRDHII